MNDEQPGPPKLKKPYPMPASLIGLFLVFVLPFAIILYLFVSEVPLSGILVGLTLSTAVGLFFGIYPARRAARLDPIAALRAETN